MKIYYSIIIFLASFYSKAQGTQLLRQPTASETEIVFVYANDLWKTSINGGNAIRLTSNEGYESSPHFSKDGKTIAFTAEYDGNTDVYIIPSEGGEPKRLTYHPDGGFVQGCGSDGEVLFRSGREAQPTLTNKLYKVSVNGSFPVAIDIPRAAYGEISDDGKGINAEIHEIMGSVEIAPGIGLADAIFDIVSSGGTLVSNGLKEVEVVTPSEAVMITNKKLTAEKQEIIDRLNFRIDAVQRSAGKKYISLNAPNDKLEAITALLPGVNSPSIMPLLKEGWSSLHSVIDEKTFWEEIDQLKKLGAEGILVTNIEKMIL